MIIRDGFGDEWQNNGCRRRKAAHPNGPLDRLCLFIHRLFKCEMRFQKLPGVRQENMAKLSYANPFGRQACEELLVCLNFNSIDRRRNGRSRYIEGLGGPGDRFMPGRNINISQLLQGITHQSL